MLHAQDDLPKANPNGTPLDFEPKLMLDGPNAAPVDAVPEASAGDRVEQLQRALILAEQRAADSEQLLKEGILAEAEVEQRTLCVVKARKELADANLTATAAHADDVKKSFDAHKASRPDLAAANAALEAARQAAATASADWDKGQLAAATIDLARKRKLFAEGVCSKREVELAEDRVALLTGTAAR